MTNAHDVKADTAGLASEPQTSPLRSFFSGFQRLPPRMVVDLDDPLGGAMEDADVLLAFAAQTAFVMKKETVQALTAAMATLTTKRHKQEEPTATEITNFWIAYDEVANGMAPLSARSIRASMSLNSKRFPFSLFTATAMNALFAIFVFICCILLQGFWGAGRELLEKAEALDTQKADLEQRIHRNEGVLWRRDTQLQDLNWKLCPPDGLCPEDGPVFEPPSKPVVRKQLLGKEEEAKLRAAKDLARQEVQEKEAVLGELSAEFKALNDRSAAVEDVIKKWYDQATGLCARTVLTILCPIRTKEASDSTRLEKLKSELAELEKKRTDRDVSVPEVPARSAVPVPESRWPAAARGETLMDLERRIGSARRAVELAEADSLRGTLHLVRLTLANIGSYLIPMLMGLLGSLAFILRSLTLQLRDHTYVHMSASLSVVRMCLGAVAGVFGTMLAPGTEGALKSLPPLILPFVFGYGIEILFSIMDRVVNSFTQPDSVKGQIKATG